MRREERYVGLLHLYGYGQGPEYLAVRRIIKAGRMALSGQEYSVVALAFGVDGRGRRSQQEIAGEMAISQRRVRCLESSAYEKLRSHRLAECERNARRRDLEWCLSNHGTDYRLTELGENGYAHLQLELHVLQAKYGSSLAADILSALRRSFLVRDFYDRQMDGIVRLRELRLSTRTTQALERLGVTSVADITQLTDRDLLAERGIGPVSLEEIRRKLASMGLALKDGAC